MNKEKAASRTDYSFEELAIWRTQLPNVKHAVLPPHTNRPNPLVREGKVYVSVFSAGAVCALDGKTGQLLWRRELPSLGSDAAHFAHGKLFAKTANTLYALEPSTGGTIWSFCPYGESGETIYSHPTVHRNNLYIGDRCGYLHCLDSRTGKTNWKVLTNTEKNSDVNSTPIITNGLVIVAMNANMAAAYSEKSGRRIWVRKLDGPSTFGPLLFRGQLVVITDSIYLLKTETGKIVRKFSWKDNPVSRADCTPRDVVCILRGSRPPDGNGRIVGVNERGIRFDGASTAFVGFIRYVMETRLMYVSHLDGIDIRRPVGGALACQIERREGPLGLGQVDVTRNRIYALSGDGFVYALRHPPVPSA